MGKKWYEKKTYWDPDLSRQRQRLLAERRKKITKALLGWITKPKARRETLESDSLYPYPTVWEQEELMKRLAEQRKREREEEKKKKKKTFPPPEVIEQNVKIFEWFLGHMAPRRSFRENPTVFLEQIKNALIKNEIDKKGYEKLKKLYQAYYEKYVKSKQKSKSKQQQQ
ncbi:MAG TPA: hypothetical protein ENG63_07565 [Candidatus Desulfofervidus auxilii]|uniref:Uncharacterized protein n=1 Tax=Desulfofervidus auxilii TaxID=1621989 RepID=A0A7C0U385_DESA2|nr:hypothetical protein [Candidatus Desulfofervidus auxilii]